MELSAGDCLMIVGPSLGYLLQTRTMISENNSDGFSPYVSFIMAVSSMIRVFWWYSERFSIVLLAASICMVFA